MKGRFPVLVVLCAVFLFSVVGLVSAQALELPSIHDYTKEIQINQFRPHGGDAQEAADMMAAFIKNAGSPAEMDKMVAKDSTTREDFIQYAKGFGLDYYKGFKIVSTSVEKLYNVKGYDVFNNYRAIVKFKYLCYTYDNKTIEKTDYIGMAKRGKLPTDWKFWGVLWRDSGVDVSDANLFQLEPPAKGEEICVMRTTAGAIKFRLFPEQTPRTVRNFKTLAENGYYDGTDFPRVINDFMIQGGSLDGVPTSGDCIYGKYFEDEFSRDLFNFRGALCMGNEGVPNTNGNQFYIVQCNNVAEAYLDLASLPLNAETKYREVGGCPYLDMRYVVFGQVFEGMEVVDRIAAQKTDENDKPIDDSIRITGIKFTTQEPEY